jgi:hypothetical protein
LRHNEDRQTRQRNKLTLLEYYAYRVAVRVNPGPGAFNILHHAGKLFEQYIIASYIKVESRNIQFIRNNQSRLRVETYTGLMDYLDTNIFDENVIPGRFLVLPSTYTVKKLNYK